MEFDDSGITDYLCRICLSKDSVDVVSLFDDNVLPNLSQKIMFCTNLKLFPIPSLPNEICKLCCDVLTIADDFRNKCRESDNFLRKLYPERFILANKLNTKEFGDGIECQNETSSVQEVDKISSKDSSNLELIPSRERILNKSIDNNVDFSYEVYIKEENSESLDNVDLVEDDFSREDKKRQILQNDKDYQSKLDENKDVLCNEEVYEGADKIFKCRKCGKALSSGSTLSRHMKVIHSEERNKAKGIIKSRTKKSKLRDDDIQQGHVDTVSNTKVIVKAEEKENKDHLANEKITKCPENVSDERSIKTCKCEECGKPLKNESTLKRHMKTMHCDGRKNVQPEGKCRRTGYGQDKRYHCNSCPYESKYWQSVVYHERLHTGEKPYECTICNRAYSQPGSLKTHLKTHSDKTYFTCAVCGRQFKYKEQFKVHMRIHSKDRELFACQICNASLKSKKLLDIHMKRHNNIKNYSCETCGLQFVALSELKSHMNKHSTEKLFECDICGFRTATKPRLKFHVSRHSRDRHLKCHSCDMSYVTKWELKIHERTHTRETNYTCSVCQRKFIHLSSIRQHMVRVHGVKYKRSEDADKRLVKRINVQESNVS